MGRSYCVDCSNQQPFRLRHVYQYSRSVEVNIHGLPSLELFIRIKSTYNRITPFSQMSVHRNKFKQHPEELAPPCCVIELKFE